MHSCSLLSPAKINLYLEIIGDRPDGYHELVMIMQAVELFDRLNIRLNGTEQIRLHSNHPEVPLDQSNLAYKAIELLKTEYPNAFKQYGGVDIHIEKNIPVSAGLAGGSGNGGAVLVGINQLWQLGLTVPELQQLSAKLGSDIAFCISGGTAIATGRGEVIDPLPDLDHLYVILGKHRNLGVSTPWAYQTFRQQFGHNYIRDPQQLKAKSQQVHSSPLVHAIAQKNSLNIAHALSNDLEKVVLPQYPQVQQLRDAFADAGVLAVMMSGSGPTVFALTETQNQAHLVKETVQNHLSDPNLDLWVTKFCSHGINLIR